MPEPADGGARTSRSVGVQPDHEVVQATARMLRCLGHPVRLGIVDLLEREGELQVSAIQDALGLEQAVASQHLGLMRDRAILTARRDGVNVYYSVADPRVLKVLECVRGGGC